MLDWVFRFFEDLDGANSRAAEVVDVEGFALVVTAGSTF
jgi:hypothetical protein